MKAVIVIDMPKTCAECRASYCGDIWYCYAGEYRKMLTQKEIYEKPSWCPLKDMPKKKGKMFLTERSQNDTDLMVKSAFANCYTDGWNACIEEITNDR